MTDIPLEQRVQALEEALRKLTTERKSRWLRLRGFLLSNWTLLSFLTGILIVVYVRFAFGIDYFEDYRNTATKKAMSEYYRRLGDEMLGKQYWRAAADAYRQSTQLNPNNSVAQYGYLKATVFDPPQNEKEISTALVEKRLDFLRQRFENDAQIHFLQACNDLVRDNLDGAVDGLKRAIALDPRFAAAYDWLGYTYTRKRQPAEALNAFKRAVLLNPRSDQARGNLGWAYLVMTDYENAIAELNKAEALAPSWINEIGLGEAELFHGDDSSILTNIAADMDAAERETVDAEEDWAVGYFPIEHPGTMDDAMPIETVESKRAFAHLAASMHFAGLGELTAANRELDRALTLDRSNAMRALAVNHLKFLRKVRSLTPAAERWVEKRVDKLEAQNG